MAKFEYVGGHEHASRIGIDPGVITDAPHYAVLVPPLIVQADSPRAKFHVEAHKPFYVDHTDPQLMALCYFLRSDRRNFRTLSTEAQAATKAGQGNSR